MPSKTPLFVCIHHPFILILKPKWILYNVLISVFIHCLEPYSLEELQFNAGGVAPILLCQICSSWRAGALSIPALWTHLRFNLTSTESDTFSFVTPTDHWKYTSFSWSRSNHTIKSPTLHLGATWKAMDLRQEELISFVEMTFLLEYMTSAQYLKLETPYWTLMQEWIDAGLGT